ncbi:uncharacterized protein [Montipora foliosa]|uniref:uncharacterized protein n=1 Tax=Montipora foliosa TaxID=591990 RepID=UPI0035F119A7
MRRNADENGEDLPLGVKAVYKHFYMDDGLPSTDSCEEAIEMRKQMTELLRRGGFRLHKWLTNYADVLATIPEQDRSPRFLELSEDKLRTDRTLGVIWHAQEDMLQFTGLKDDPGTTKRKILSQAFSVWDPRGLLLPFSIRSKIILQNLNRMKYRWDDELKEADLQEWREWRKEAEKLDEVRIPRALIQEQNPVRETALHVFCDASQNAGPKFLYESAELWSENKVKAPCKNDDIKEKKKERWAGASQENKVLLGWKKYSSLTKLRRVTAYVMRFANNVRAKKEARLLGALTSNELRAAQNYLVKSAQVESFGEEIQCLKIGEQIHKKSRIKSLDPRLEDGFLVVGGRLQRAQCLPYRTRHLKIIDSHHELAQLIVEEMHRNRVEISPPSAPHFGGASERLVQCTKKTLKAILEDRAVSKEVLRTALVEAEGILNSPPITHVSNDAGDIEALTPNHFLLLRANPSYEDAEVSDREINSTKMWRQSQALANFFWGRFTKEYLSSLTEERNGKRRNRTSKKMLS